MLFKAVGIGNAVGKEFLKRINRKQMKDKLFFKKEKRNNMTQENFEGKIFSEQNMFRALT